MTRQEFVETVTEWNELLDIFSEYDYDYDEIVWYDDLDSNIYDDLANCDWNWRDIRDALADIEADGDYFRRDGYLSYTCIDDEFDSYWEHFLEWMDDNGYWDDPEDDDWDEEDDDEEIEEEDLLTEDFEAIVEVFQLSVRAFREAQENEADIQKESRQDLDRLMGVLNSSNNIIGS